MITLDPNTDFFQRNNVDVRSARSPDLNPIEHLWDISEDNSKVYNSSQLMNSLSMTTKCKMAASGDWRFSWETSTGLHWCHWCKILNVIPAFVTFWFLLIDIKLSSAIMKCVIQPHDCTSLQTLKILRRFSQMSIPIALNRIHHTDHWNISKWTFI